MVVRSSTDEFERDGVKAVRENVKSGHYGEPKKQQALMWLNEQKTKRKQFRDTKDLLTLAPHGTGHAADTRRRRSHAAHFDCHCSEVVR